MKMREIMNLVEASNSLWWIPDMEREIERDEQFIAGKADHEKVRLPVGDASFETVAAIKARIADKRQAIDQAKAEG